MSISLNISSNSAKSMPNQNPYNGKKKKKSSQQNDFNFTFTETKTPVKPLLAKRRTPQLLAKKLLPATVAAKSVNGSGSSSSSPSNNKSTFTLAKQLNNNNISQSIKKKESEKVDYNSRLSVDQSTTSINLSLNVIPGNEEDRLKRDLILQKKQMTQKQRKEFILQKRAQQFQETEKVKLAKPEPSVIKPVASVEQQPQKQKPQQQQQPRIPNSQPQQANVKNFKEKPKRMPSLFSNMKEIPSIGQRLVKPVNEVVFTGAGMNSVGLHDHMVKTLSDILGITELTTVQQRTIPIALSGRDVLVRSQTGSGKTLAYALPVVQKLQEIRPKITRDSGIFALIIVPTSEITIQVYEILIKLLKPFTWIVPGYVTTGEKRKAEKARLRKGINILVGTPGRLCDHLLHTESFKLDKVKYLVLDEADRLFELSYEKFVRQIVDGLNDTPSNGVTGGNPFKIAEKKIIENSVESKMQTMLLSATLPSSVRELAGLALKNPMFIDTSDVTDADIKKTNIYQNKNVGDNETATLAMNEAIENAMNDDKIVLPSTVTQSYVFVPPKLRLVTLSGLIKHETKSSNKKILVFLATEHLVDFHYDLMVEGLTRKVLDSDDEDDYDMDDGDDIMLKNKRKKRLLNDDDNDINSVDSLGDDNKPILDGVRFFKLHGSLTQVERSSVFKAFKETRCGVLLTTDVAARGIDIPMVNLIVQFSPPQYIADYVHRVGRTARAGQKGHAILFLAPNESEFIRILEDKKVRISPEELGKYLKCLNENQLTQQTVEESASELQRKFESIVVEDKEMHDRACKAFISWTRYISAFPKEFRTIFNIKHAHMGHYAKSLGLREPPKSFSGAHSAPKPELPRNRLTYTERSGKRPKDNNDNNKQQKGQKRGADGGHQKSSTNLNKFVKKSISLSTSEFGSGLAPMKKRKMN